VDLSDFEQKMVGDIAQYGWFGMHVLAAKNAPSFSYTVGLWETLGSPELMILGLPSNLSHSMLKEMFRKIQSGLVMEDGTRVRGVLEGYDCIARRVHSSRVPDYLLSALWYRRHKLGESDGLRVMQIFWPGRSQGLFPWEAGCDANVRSDQPLLYLPKETGLA
jgi:hypothetical protein